MSKSHLVPKVITNKNGKQQTVYVRPEELNKLPAGCKQDVLPLAGMAAPERDPHFEARFVGSKDVREGDYLLYEGEYHLVALQMVGRDELNYPLVKESALTGEDGNPFSFREQNILVVNEGRMMEEQRAAIRDAAAEVVEYDDVNGVWPYEVADRASHTAMVIAGYLSEDEWRELREVAGDSDKSFAVWLGTSIAQYNTYGNDQYWKYLDHRSPGMSDKLREAADYWPAY